MLGAVPASTLDHVGSVPRTLMPIASKYPGVTIVMGMQLPRSFPGSTTSTYTPLQPPALASGSVPDAPACTTPGIASTRCVRSRQKPTTSAAFGYRACGTMIDIDVTPTGSNPGLTLRRCENVFAMSAALLSNTTASATCERTRPRRATSRARELVSPRPPSRSNVTSSMRPANRQQPEHESERQRRDNAELDAAPVERYFIEARQRLRRNRQHDVQQCPRDRDRAGGGDEREEDALGEIVNGEMRAIGAECGAHRNLAPARVDANEKQVRDVGRGDQKHEAHSGEQQPDGANDRAAHDRVAQRRHVHREAAAIDERLAIDVRIVALELDLDLLELGQRSPRQSLPA